MPRQSSYEQSGKSPTPDRTTPGAHYHTLAVVYIYILVLPALKLTVFCELLAQAPSLSPSLPHLW